MKLFALAIAAAQAQDTFDFPSLGDFDLSAFGLGPDAFNVPVAPAVNVEVPDEERYFFTTAATTPVSTTPTTTTIVSGQSCWKCDAMTYATCASTGSYQLCDLGDKDCCFVEMRETKGALQQLCTGCKAAQACEDNKDENFQGAIAQHHQCRPDYRYQRFGQRADQQSTCRQCFNKCDPTASVLDCFGAIDHNNSNAAQVIKLALVANSAAYPWASANLAAMGRTDTEYADALGIPTGFVLDDSSSNVNTAITGLSDLLNVYTLSGTTGKTSVANDNNTADKATEQVFWGLQGADQTWWSTNLKAIQNVAVDNPTAVTQLK